MAAGLLKRRTARYIAIALAAAALGLVLTYRLGPLFELETRLQDRVQIALAPPGAAQNADVAIVSIDEATMATLPYRSPVDRGLIADLIDILAAAGAASIGVDILLDQPTEPAKDARLADAIARFDGPVVVAWADARAGMTEAQSAWLQAFIEASGARPGFANLTHDPDGVVRRHAVALSGTDVQSFAAALAGRAAPRSAGSTWRIDWLQSTADGAPPFQKTPAHILPLMRANPAILTTWYAGRTVLIGADLPQQDRHPTPLSMTRGGADTAGVDIHAHLIAQIRDDRTAPETGPLETAAYVAFAALAATGLAVLGVPFLLRLLLLAALIAGHLGLTALLFQAFQAATPIVAATIAIVLAAAGAAGLDALLAHRDKRFVRQAFAHYLAPALVDRLVRNPEALKLGGERRLMTFLFTDIAGFTGMSERMEAEDLAALLNDYLDGVSAIVMAHGGVIDKYIGDAVVGLFGAPEGDARHAADAIACAAEIDRFAEAFRAERAASGLGVTRIGVHTGEAVVGNFGGHARFDYTAIGDAMNTAARLEGANKAFGTRVCFSRDCLEAARPFLDDPPPMRPVGEVLLKGKTVPMPVIALAADVPCGQLAGYIRAYDLLGPAPEEAKSILGSLAPDSLVSLHLERLARGETGAVFELTEK